MLNYQRVFRMKAQWIQGSFSGRFFFRSRVTYFISNPGILSLKKIVSFSFVLSLSIYMYIILMFAYVFVYLCLCYFVIYYTHMCLRCLESIHLRSITNDSWCSNPQLWQMARTLSTLRHPDLVLFLGASLDGDTSFFLTEYMEAREGRSKG